MVRVPWTVAQAYAGEPIESRKSRNRISGIFLATGAILAFSALIVIPGWEVRNRSVIALIGIIVTISAVSQAVFASRVPIVMNHVASIVGTGTIAAAQVLAGYPVAIATVGLLYVWVSVFTAVFYSTRAAFVHVGVIIAAQISVLAYLRDPDLIAQVIVTAATCVTATFIVSWLIRDLRRQVTADPLTGMVNRRGLDIAFTKALAVCRRSGGPLVVAVVDLDGFKSVNDSHGHAEGDRVLVECARSWQNVLRPSDVLARTGGDEFMILMPNCHAEDAMRVATRVRQATPAGLDCSIGVVIVSDDDDRDAVMARADRAMYQAKQDLHQKIVVAAPVSSPAVG